MSFVGSRRVVLPDLVDRTLAWFIPHSSDPHLLRNGKVVVGFTLAILAWSPLYALLYLAIFPAPYAKLALTSLGIGMAMIATVPVLIRVGAPIGMSISLLGVSLVGLLGLLCWITGGVRSPLMTWMVLHPLVALGFGGVRLAWIWTACVLAELAVFALAPILGLPVYNVISPGARDVLWGGSLVAITLTVFLVAWIHESIKNQAIRELQYASQAKSEFLAHMSHEIRTPMTAVLGFTELLEDEKLTGDQLEHLRTIRRNGAHLLSVINDILDLARVESGRMELDYGPVRPARLLRDLAALVAPRARERGLELRVEIDPAAEASIRSDATRLQQILINLSANAVKFTPSGSVRLSVKAEPTGYLRFDVEDSGPGIPREMRELLFEAFTQGDASMSRRHGGTGLGLAISRGLATALGGTLELESGPSGGNTFTLRIPAERSLDAMDSPEAAAEPDPQSALHGRVLLAEDGADSRRLVVHLLERWGLEVETAENGARALEIARAAESRGAAFDLVLMDMQMPEIDGYEATRRLRGDGFTGRIVALTAHAMAGSRETCLAAGCDDFLSKPIDRALLRAVVAKQIRYATAARA